MKSIMKSVTVTIALLGFIAGGSNAWALDTGVVEIQNNYGEGEFSIRLYHADAIDRVFGKWEIGGNQTVVLQTNGQEFVVGDDWLIDIEFRNGVKSGRHQVGKVGNHGNNKFKIPASNIFNGKK